MMENILKQLIKIYLAKNYNTLHGMFTYTFI